MSILEWIALIAGFVILLACLFFLLNLYAGVFFPSPEQQRQIHYRLEEKRKRQQQKRLRQRQSENELEVLRQYFPPEYQVDWYRFVEPPPQHIIDQARYVRSLVERQSPE